ncbi:hypothetical protein [uncultured Pseudosulfitobacter sp.]|uniref:hypothetical protein n=1 Tax=uncultured Pseudosulfitobacter sp. TaxID=2854214 RepID=UPI0030DACDDE|tara:strand:+ start:950 stop:1135 length:186 start_codon:yes stop_codon:yes gene_type:complete
MPAPRATKAVIANAIEAAKACGMLIAEVVVEKDGSVRIIADRGQKVIPLHQNRAEPRRFGQ